MSLNYSELLSAIQGSAAAFRSITRLQPVGGPGDKIFPVTYANAAYARERRRLEDGRVVDCVLIDSVQSQSNRAEQALKHALERGLIQLPIIEVDFSEANTAFRVPIENLTTLDVPHRLADAILRDSQLVNGTRFSKSEFAARWGRANLWNATPVYELCPTALTFGMWGNPDKPGGLGAKFERAYVSEIVAVDVVQNHEGRESRWSGRILLNGAVRVDVVQNHEGRENAEGGRKDLIDKRAGFRIDPANASSAVLLKPKSDGSFETAAKGGVKPSELNHGNILFESQNTGIRCAYAEQTTVISLGALRKLHFPLNGSSKPEIDDSARAVLAVVSLCAGTLAAESGTSLRSRCQLWPEAPREWELLDTPGEKPKSFHLTGEQAAKILNDAVEEASKLGLDWMHEKLVLKPTPELVDLIRLSQEAQAKEKGEGEVKKESEAK